MSIQKYDYSGVLNAIYIEEWVSYDDHISALLNADRETYEAAERMREACITAVEALPLFHNAAMLHKVEDVLAALREVQP